MNLEEELKAVIEAQVEGGYYKFKWVAHKYYTILHIQDEYVSYLESSNFARKINESEPYGEQSSYHILEILLDTEGLKAAYGKEPHTNYYLGMHREDGYKEFEYNSIRILEAWNSEAGNNYKAAINTAYELL